MPLAGRQSVERPHNVLSRQAGGLFSGHSFNHFAKRRATGERRCATIGEKTRGLDAPPAQPQTEAQAITAHRIGLFGYSVGPGQFPGVARIG